ncbi:GNAT family N-acetyltransferase [Frigidibacter mobilis]|uniref:Putative acetyl transferase n=1 Tax=Frigidibacter mobilis TaxID=1335048 RepID=A0A159Z8Q1_9RHOB|nr:GNAT family N-acetyltransferase [Frigidibacter mobilis]AMY71926.1 putative acetyl transferase [Frigidibacter mobilis]
MIDLPAVMDGTWPAAALHRAGPWLVREGRGGGKRVSAASAEAPWRPADIALAEAAQAALGQPALFVLRAGEEALDAELEARGYRVVDPVVAYAAPVAQLTTVPVPPVRVFDVWPPLAIQTEIWAEGGIGPERLAVMARGGSDRTALLGRINDRAAGAAFVALHAGTAMLHALHILPDQQRNGLGAHMMRGAAFWAQDRGAGNLSLVVTRENAPARALYASLGMQIVGQYHYRMK